LVNKLINQSVITFYPISNKSSLKITVSAKYIAANGTAVEEVCVTGEASRLHVPVAWQGNCPGGKPVWRNICHHGA
jgi:hypothetical protein